MRVVHPANAAHSDARAFALCPIHATIYNRYSGRFLHCNGNEIFQQSGIYHSLVKLAQVRVSRRAVHPKYKKRTTISKKVMAHDETEMCEEGQVVRLEAASKKMSARKRWVVAEICAPQGCEGM